MSLSSSTPDDLLRAGLTLIAAAPPEVGTRLPRGARLLLQARLLAALPDWSPPRLFRICWRTVFSWGSDARISCGEACWETPNGPRTAAFAVDPRRCTLGPARLPEVAILALHIGQGASHEAA